MQTNPTPPPKKKWTCQTCGKTWLLDASMNLSSANRECRACRQEAKDSQRHFATPEPPVREAAPKFSAIQSLEQELEREWQDENRTLLDEAVGYLRMSFGLIAIIIGGWIVFCVLGGLYRFGVDFAKWLETITCGSMICTLGKFFGNLIALALMLIPLVPMLLLAPVFQAILPVLLFLPLLAALLVFAFAKAVLFRIRKKEWLRQRRTSPSHISH
jgi:hypothetical protein